MGRLIDQLPRGNTLNDASWLRRHRLLQWVLLGHIPAMALLGLWLGNSPLVIALTLIGPVLFLVLGRVFTGRRLASFFVTGGLVFCSAGLVILTSGRIEAHFHFFIIIGFIALYQDWVPFLWNVAFTVLSHGVGSIWFAKLIFDHSAGQSNPWLWSAIHGIAVLAACVGMVIFWRITEEEQNEREALSVKLVSADAEIGRQQFTSDMLVNLARRNQSMLHRQIDIINQMEEKEQDPDALSELFKLDHLATRVRRNAENLLVLAGEQPPRTWSAPVLLRDVVRAAIAETEDLDRVVFAVGDHIAVAGRSVADLTHLLAELTENAVRFSPPDTAVTIRARPDRRNEGGHLLTVEDWGVGMPPEDVAAANEQLSRPREVDLAVAKRLGFHVVSRLAARHGIGVSLGATPGSGVTAVVALPPDLFAEALDGGALPVREARPRGRELPGSPAERGGWVEPVSTTGARPGRSNSGFRLKPVQVEPAPQPAPQPVPPPMPQPVLHAVSSHAVSSHAVSSHAVSSPPMSRPMPQPAPEPLPQIPDRDWPGWWNPESMEGDGPRPPAPAPVVRPPAPSGQLPVPHPRPRPEGGSHAAGDDSGRPGLRRRVPQAHLAPELRQLSEVDDAPAPATPAAASALSRYQASRQAALVEADGRGERA